MMEIHLPEEQDLRSMDLGKLLPQGEGFLMVGTLVFCDGERTVSETLISADNPFCADDGRFLEAGLLENIAQTCALRMGILCQNNQEAAPKMGVIAAVRKMDMSGTVRVGDTLRTEVIVEAEAFGMLSCRGLVECNGQQICEAELRLMV